MSKSDVGIVARVFSSHVGMIQIIITDGAPECIGKPFEFRKWFQGHGVTMKHMSRGQPRYN